MDIQDELYHHGLWIHGSRLVKTDVYRCPLPQLLVVRPSREASGAKPT